MLFIGRTMNKETTEQKKERKREREGEKQGSPRCYAYCGISRSSQNRFPVNVYG